MIKTKPTESKIWVHHASKDSVCVVKDSEQYHNLLESGYRLTRTAVLKDQGFLEDAAPDVTPTLPKPCEYKELTDSELTAHFLQVEGEMDARNLFPEVDQDEDTGQADTAAPIENAEPTEEEIREKGKELGIPSWHVMSIQNLLVKIKEAEDAK